MYTIGVDIGGMSAKIGVVDDSGKIIRQGRVTTSKHADKCISDIILEIENLLLATGFDIKYIRGIGVGCPGTVCQETGMILYLSNLNWKNVPLGKILSEKFGIPTTLSNDANAAVVGELKYGCAKEYNTVVMYTIGTGLGSGIIIDKKLYEGYRSLGAEMGHTTLIQGGKPCGCGRRGCLEKYVSATSLIEQTKQAMLDDNDSLMWDFVKNDIENIDGRTAFECSKHGDQSAINVIEKYVEYLGDGILNAINIFRPDGFIIGGGVSAQGEYLRKKVQDYCEKFNYGYNGMPKTDILVASLGNDAGIIGAAALLE